jgi:hypothetical protein
MHVILVSLLAEILEQSRKGMGKMQLVDMIDLKKSNL